MDQLHALIMSLEQELATAQGADVGRVRLKLGDAQLKLGDVDVAVEHYLAATEHLTSPLQKVAILRQCVQLVPARRDLRPGLADGYVALGLVDDARTELTALLAQCEHAGIADEIEDARRRLAALPPPER
jgi:hypothetical protein